MSFLENLKKIKPFRAAQDFFGGQGSGGLLGALMSGYGAYKMANPSVNRGFLNQMNQNLAPLQESKAIDRSLMTDAISNALRNFSKGASQRQATANQLYGQQAQMGNILAQARGQNQLLAQQQGQFLPQYLGQTGLGLLNRAWTQ